MGKEFIERRADSFYLIGSRVPIDATISPIPTDFAMMPYESCIPRVCPLIKPNRYGSLPRPRSRPDPGPKPARDHRQHPLAAP
jgi:hypothetical protein